MKKKLMSLLLCLAMAGTLMMGCSSGEKEVAESSANEEQSEEKVGSEEEKGQETQKSQEGVKIAFIIPHNNEWNQQFFEQAKKDCEARGYEAVVFDAQNDQQKQVDYIQSCITQEFTAIAIQPVNNAAVAPALKEAAEAGLLVITQYTMEEELGLNDIIYEVAFDQFGVGVASAEEFVKQTGEEGKVAIIAGPAGAANAEARTEGIKSVLEAYPGMEIVQVASCDFDRQKAMAAAEDILTSHPDLTAFISQDDNMSVGVYEAIKAAGKEGKVQIASIGLTEDGAKYIEEGKFLCSVSFPAGAFATPGVEMTEEWVTTGTTEDKIVGYYAVNKDNVAEAEW